LAAIVIEAMLGLADFAYLKRLRSVSLLEFSVAMAALFGVLILGVLPGIGLGVALALLLLIYRASYPGTAELGQLPGEDHFGDVSLHPEAKRCPGLLIFQFESSLIFPNANYFVEQVKQRLEGAADPVREILIDCENMNLLDTTGANALIDLAAELREKGVSVSLARARDPIMERLSLNGVDKALGEDRLYDTITEGVKAFEGQG
jgi:MFS superfamily sulfate permease-like transporter